MKPHTADDSAECLRLGDGRRLCYQLFGHREGTPVYFFHGFPGSRLQAALVERQAAAANVCLVAFDRPGFGLSDPDPARTLSSSVGDVAALAHRLGHPRFGVIGVSCGGAYALACAHDLSERVCHVGLLAGMGPMDRPGIRQGQLPILGLMFRLARLSPVLIAPLLLLDRALYRGDPDRAVRLLADMLTAPDRALLAADTELGRQFSAALAEAYRQGVRGAMREAQLIGSRRPYALERITVPVDVYQGEHDRHVPPAMGRYIAESVRNGTLHSCPADGHLSVIVNQAGPCLDRMAASYGHSQPGRDDDARGNAC